MKPFPSEFISFHAKGRPEYISTHVCMCLSHHLQEISTAFATIFSFPSLNQGKTSIIIVESDPEGAAAAQGPQLAYRNSTMYSSYTAASFARKHELAHLHGVNLESVLTWAFEFENQRHFAGFRALNIYGIELPVLNAFRIFAGMGDFIIVEAVSDAQYEVEKILREGVGGERADVGVLASFSSAPNSEKFSVMVLYYHDDHIPGPVADIKLEGNELQGK